MNPANATFQEAGLDSTPIARLGLAIAGTWLAPTIAEFEQELKARGIVRIRPHFYLSTEWGVPFGTVAIAIPFYLARKELTQLHRRHAGYVEGHSRTDVLRYLRHEMGHVMNYGYRLYEREDWVALFGSMTQPYVEEYRPQPFSRRFVRHLPGWYAQKHPDEDWSETFAVWMTPGFDWRADYADWPQALAKLQYCEETMSRLKETDPANVAVDLDEDVEKLDMSVAEHYQTLVHAHSAVPRGLDGALRAIFDDFQPEGTAATRTASTLIRRLQGELSATVYRWTGHFPERTHELLRHLADRADRLRQVYPETEEVSVAIALTALTTALAMNYVLKGSYDA
jgi:hypothetical protein